jgi:hypothetical protein
MDLPFIHEVHQREERKKRSGESTQDHPERYVLMMEKCSERQSYEGHGWRGKNHKKIPIALSVYPIFGKKATSMKGTSMFVMKWREGSKDTREGKQNALKMLLFAFANVLSIAISYDPVFSMTDKGAERCS